MPNIRELPSIFADKLPFIGNKAEVKRNLPIVYHHLLTQTRKHGMTLELENSDEIHEISVLTLKGSDIYFNVRWDVKLVDQLRYVDLTVSDQTERSRLFLKFHGSRYDNLPVFVDSKNFFTTDSQGQIQNFPLSASRKFIDELISSDFDEEGTKKIFEDLEKTFEAVGNTSLKVGKSATFNGPSVQKQIFPK